MHGADTARERHAGNLVNHVAVVGEELVFVDAVADVTPPILSGVGYGGGCALAHAAC
jgi:hypothetical protein